jgi:putative alpha-1,2-mannosidase
MFSMSSKMDGNVSPDITGLIGQYAHGNEPVHHVPYLFALAGQPADGERWIRQIRDTMYRAAPDGLAGNDDLGQMSAWYVLSSLGFYPVNPVDSGYVRGVPEFRHIRLQLDNGKQLTVRIDGPMPGQAGQRDTAITVQRWTLNGQPLGVTLSHQQLQQGGELVFYTR